MDPAEVAGIARRVGDRAASDAASPSYSSGAPLPGGQPRGLRDPVEAFRTSGVADDPRRRPVGLVLAGGGAKGAYQAGVARFLAESGVQVVAVAGASIGALNGAVLAAAPTLGQGAELLYKVWRHVAEETGPPPFTSGVALDEGTLEQLLNLPARALGPMLRPGFLDDLLARYVDPGGLHRGLPMYVTTFRGVDPALVPLSWRDLLEVRELDGPVRAAGRVRVGWAVDIIRSWAFKARSDWLYINDLPLRTMHNAILASAAIPVVMPPRNVGGVPMRDGDLLGDGNMPVGALVGRIPCRRMIAVHLKALPLFHPGEYAEHEVIEIRPSRPLEPKGPVGALSAVLDLSPARVDALYETGYDDAREQLSRAWAEDAVGQVATFMNEHRRSAVAELGVPLHRIPPEGDAE
ncbi:patatin-like phospholipase family protein [Streptomyces mirabilis]|uniref:patatin-like phospholipase family protein n=1 Tax=Streptomyces mirabilis TaxID=68239 RepID=UPI0021C003F1|nr:patatin-like phospholipase family protein [Streptomyces mirabilis]MCT9114060.1 patatin-like phospholipase family protein [Streptomyces mirabilis]